METMLDDCISKYVSRAKKQRQTTETVVMQDLVKSGYDSVVLQLYTRYKSGEITFRKVAAELGND